MNVAWSARPEVPIWDRHTEKRNQILGKYSFLEWHFRRLYGFFPRFTLKTFARIVLYYKWFINKERKKVRGLTNICREKKKYIDTTHIHIYTLFGSLFYICGSKMDPYCTLILTSGSSWAVSMRGNTFDDKLTRATRSAHMIIIHFKMKGEKKKNIYTTKQHTHKKRMLLISAFIAQPSAHNCSCW